MTNVNTVAFVAAMNASAEAPQVEAATVYGSKLDAAKAKAKALEDNAKALARIAENDAKANAKALEIQTLSQSIELYAIQFKAGEAKTKTMWDQICRDLRIHFGLDETQTAVWYQYTSANCRGNERGIWERLEEIRKLVQEAARNRGVIGIDKAWSDIKAYGRKQKALASGGEPREKKALDTRQKSLLTALYKSGMKEERPTEQELRINAIIGNLLKTEFKVDLSTLEK